MWGEAVRHSTYIINRVATKALEDKTPYETFNRKKPNIEHLRVFGCIAQAKINGPYLRKLDERSKSMINLGTEPSSKAYRLYDPLEKRVVVSRDVVFEEEKAWDWSTTTNESDGEPGTFTILHSGLAEEEEGHEHNQNNNHHDHEPIEHDEEEGDNINHEDDLVGEPQQLTTRYGRAITKPKYLDDFVLLADLEGVKLLFTVDGEPDRYFEAARSKEWIDAMESELDSIVRNQTWELIDKPRGVKVIGLKWIFKIKRKVDGSVNKHKARLVAKGYVQEQGVDSKMRLHQ